MRACWKWTNHGGIWINFCDPYATRLKDFYFIMISLKNQTTQSMLTDFKHNVVLYCPMMGAIDNNI